MNLDYLVETDAETVAETIMADFLDRYVGRSEVAVNGICRRGMNRERTLPDRPRIVVEAGESEFPHRKAVNVEVTISIEFFALGAGPVEKSRAAGQHGGTDSATAARWRSILRDTIYNADKWNEYFTELKAELGDDLPRWVPGSYHITAGNADFDESSGAASLETVVKMAMKSNDSR